LLSYIPRGNFAPLNESLISLTFFAKTEHVSSLEVKYLNSIVDAISNCNPASLIYTYVVGINKLSFAKALAAEFPNRFAIGVKYLNSVIVLLRD
jgi:hypothetical protein